MNYQYERNRIYAEDETGKLLAEITFPETDNGIFTIDHTFVDDSLGGQGIAGKLVGLAVEHIQKSGGQVKATCDYAAHWLKKHGVH